MWKNNSWAIPTIVLSFENLALEEAKMLWFIPRHSFMISLRRAECPDGIASLVDYAEAMGRYAAPLATLHRQNIMGEGTIVYPGLVPFLSISLLVRRLISQGGKT